MTNLKCSVVGCYHNQDRLCCLDKIKVKGSKAEISESTECASFEEKSKGMVKSCGCHASPNTSLTIECEAVKCTYNDNEKCTAKGISVEGTHANAPEETMCATFKVQ